MRDGEGEGVRRGAVWGKVSADGGAEEGLGASGGAETMMGLGGVGGGHHSSG